MGGSHQENGTAIARDSAGNVYVTGFTDSLDFPTTPGAYQEKRTLALPFTGCLSFGTCTAAIFVTKFSPDGTKVIYSTLIADSLTIAPRGRGGLRSYGIVVNRAGEAIIIGETTWGNFPRTGTFQDRCPQYTTCGFVARLSPDGSKLLSVSMLGRSQKTFPWSIVLDSQENVIVAGGTYDDFFPTFAGSLQPVAGRNCCTPEGYSDGADGFVAKLDPTASRLLFSTYIGGMGIDEVVALAVDSDDNIFVGGLTNSKDFPVTPGAFQTDFSPVNNYTGFVVKLDTSLSRAHYSTLFGGSNNSVVGSVFPAPDGTLLVAGDTRSTDFPVTTNAFQPDYHGGFGDAFVSALDVTGSHLVFSTFLGGTGQDWARAVFIAADGRIVVVGETYSRDFPLKGSLK